MAAEMTVHCPKCDSTDIHEKNVAYAEIEVFGWDWTETDGLQPTDYDSVSADWEVDNVKNQYACHGCWKWKGRLDQLVVRNRPEDEKQGEDP